jgi:serine protease Do
MLAAAMILGTITVPAQDSKKVKKQKQEEIIIKKKADKDGKMTIVIDGDDVTINGKPVTEFNDDDLSVRKIKRDFSFDGPHTDVREFGWAPPVPVPPMPPIPPVPPYFSGRGAISIDGDHVYMNNEPKAMLGVYTEKDEKGARITRVAEGSPAEKAGLQKGDIITKVNDKAIADPAALSGTINDMKPGDEIRLVYIRDGKEKKVTVKLGERAASFSRSFNFNAPEFNQDLFRNYNFNGPLFNNRPRLGIKIQDIEEGNGVKVIDMDEASPAAKSGIQKDDIITGIDGTDIKNTDDAREKMADLKDKSVYTVKVLRNGNIMNIEVKVPKKLKTTDL